MPITPLPTAPDPNDPATFDARAAAWVAALAVWTTQVNSLPAITSSYTFTDGTAAAPSVTFASATSTGMFKLSGITGVGITTNGTEAVRWNASGAMFMGSPNNITGLGGARLTSMGTGLPSTQIALGMFAASNIGTEIQLAKSRGAVVDDYTIVQTGDILGRLNFWGSDGTTMVKGAGIISQVLSAASGDVRSSLLFQTGSGAGGSVATRLTIDGSAITASLPVSVTGNLNASGNVYGGFAALGAVAPGSLALNFRDVVSVTPNATGTFATGVPPAGAFCAVIINTSGTTPYTLTFGTGFKSTGTLATGTVTAKTFTVTFVSDGTVLNEVSRTVAM